jgi:hypothetical protein
MKLSEIQEAVGRKCSLLDGSGNFVDGLVSAEDITALANLRWREIHVRFSDKFPDDLAIEVTLNLVKDQGDYEITGLNTSEYTLPYVGVKYSASDQYYRKVRRSRDDSLNKVDTDTRKFSTTAPFYSRVAESDSTPPGSAQVPINRLIRLRPIPDANVTAGLFLKVIEMPAFMEIGNDTPYTLPEAAHSLIVDFVVADVWEIKRDWTNSNEALNRAMLSDKLFFQNYQPTTADIPVRISPGKGFNPYRGR